MRTSLRLTGLVGAVMVASVIAVPASAASDGDVPEAVERSVLEGGDVYAHVLRLDQTNPDGSTMSGHDLDDAVARAARTTFGHVMRYAYLELPENGGTGETLSEKDLGDLAPFYLAVEYIGDQPASTVQITAEGEFAALGGFTPQEVARIATLEEGQVLLSDGRYGELYAADSGLSVVTALNEPARDLAGQASVSVTDLRAKKAAQWTAYTDALPENLPEDSSGIAGTFTGATPTSPVFGITIAVVGLALVATCAFVLGRRTTSGRATEPR